MAKIALHKKIPCEYTVPAGQIHAFAFNLKAGGTSALALTANHTFSETSLDDFTVGKHTLKVFKPDPNNSQNKVMAGEYPVYISPGLTDEISKNQEVLQAITAVLEGKATDDLQSYTLAGRSITKMTVADLERLQAKYAEAVRQEKASWQDGNPQTGNKFKNIKFAFGVNENV